MKKNHELKIRFDKEDKEKLQKKADSLRIKLSTYIRMVSLNADIKMETSNKKND